MQARDTANAAGDVIGDVDAAARFVQNPHVDILDVLARPIDDGR